MLQTRRSWTGAFCLAICLALATAQDCEVSYNDVPLTTEEWTFGLTLPAVPDIAAPDTDVAKLQVNRVESTTIIEADKKYLDIDSTTPGEIRLFLTQEFTLFEEQEIAISFSRNLEFLCNSGDRRSLSIVVPLVFSNNHNPQFENQNDGNGYKFNLPMPFPRGVSITSAYNPIFAFDVDITNTGIQFTLEDPSGLFEVVLEKKDETPLKTRYYANLQAISRLELTQGVDLKIIATDNEGTTLSTPADIRIDVDVENSDPLPSFFEYLLYTSQLPKAQPPGPITTNPSEIKIVDYPAGDIVVELVDAPGDTPFYPGAFTAHYTVDTGLVEIRLVSLPAEALEDEVIVMVLKASQVTSIFTAETVVHVNLLGAEPTSTLAFESALYTATIDNPEAGLGEIPTIPTPIKLVISPAGSVTDVTVQLLQTPNGAPWISDLFTVTFAPATGEVTLSLARTLTPADLANEALIMVLKATSASDPDVTTETIVHVDLPSLTDPPIVDSSFSSPLYTAVITESQAPGPITTVPTPITILNAPDGVIDVVVEQAPGEGAWFDDLFSATYTEGTNTVVLNLDRPLTPTELNNEVLIVKIRASQLDSLSIETIVQVDLPTIVVPPLEGSSFEYLLYTAAITESQTPGPITTVPTPIKILNAPDGVIDVVVEQAPGEGAWFDDLFSAEYTDGTVVLKLDRALTPAELNNEVLIVKIRASQVDTTLAETIVQVDLPPIVEPPPFEGSAFESLLYTAVITESQAPGPITTVPSPITILNAPDGVIDIVVEQAGEGAWYNDLFSAEYIEVSNMVVLTLDRPLTPAELNNEVLIFKIRASQLDTTLAETIVYVDLPPLVEPPPLEGSSFDSPLYTAAITESQAPGPISTDPTPIIILNAPDGIEVVVEKAPGEGVWYDGLFSMEYTAGTNTVVLSLVRELTPTELNNEALLVQITASQLGLTFAKTIVHVDLPPLVEPPPVMISTFESPLYTAVLTESQAPGPISTDPTPITILNAPDGIEVVVEQAPGEVVWYDGLFSVEYTAGTNTVVLSLDRRLTADELNNEALLIKIKASQASIVLSETIVHVDLPAIFDAQPGTFESPLYTSVIAPEMPPGPITTHTAIKITDPPSGTIALELLHAPGEVPSYEDFFSATYMGAGIVEIRLIKALTEDVLENEVLILQLRATQAATPDFSGETIIHIDLPATECPQCTTLFPTEPPTCAPCLCTTTTAAPPASIVHDQDPYIGSKNAGQLGLIFTVKALYNGVPDIFYYNFETNNEGLLSTLSIDHTSGDLTLKRDLAPGIYRFQVTARHEASGDERPAAAILEIRSVAECEDGVTCFRYALTTLEIPEATANDNIIPGTTPSDCVYSFNDQKPATDWFTISPTTGQVGVTAEADCEDELFNGLPRAEVLLRLQVVCGPEALLLTNGSTRDVNEAVTRQQMLVLVTLTNKNEFDPEFPNTAFTVAYPKQDLARQILPGPITVVQATDKDVGESEGLTYALQNVNAKFSVHPQTGYLYPVDGAYDYKDATVSILANDQDGKNGRTTVQIRHVDDTQVAVLAVSGAVLEDTADILERLNTELPHEWGALKAAVVAEDVAAVASPALRNRLRRAAERAGGLFLVVYALDESNKQPKPYSELKTQLESLEPGSLEWSITLVQTWEEAGSGTGTPGGEEVNAALEVATITLGVLVGLLVIAIVVILYITVFRRKQQDKLAAKTGFKNRTSFSKESGGTENGKKNGLYPDWGAETKPAEDPDDRRKSMVTFSDEPEVIPLESARL